DGRLDYRTGLLETGCAPEACRSPRRSGRDGCRRYRYRWMMGPWVWAWRLLRTTSCWTAVGVTKRLAAIGTDRRPRCKPLPALDADIDEVRVELDDPGPAAGSFSGDQGGADAAKRVEDHSVAVGAVADRVRDHGDGLHRRVQRQFAFGGSVQRILADIVP